MVSRHPELGRERLSFPDVPAIEKRAGLYRHLVLRIHGPGDDDLVEQIEEIQLFIEHDGGTKDRVGPGLFQFLEGVG